MNDRERLLEEHRDVTRRYFLQLGPERWPGWD